MKIRTGHSIITENEKYTVIAVTGEEDERDKKVVFKRARDEKLFLKNLSNLRK